MTKEDKKNNLPAILSSSQPIVLTDGGEAIATLASRELRAIENFRERLRAKLRDHFQALVFITLILLFILVFLAPRIFIIIDSGAVGVKYDLRYGTQVDYIYSEGLNIIAPWNRMYIYNIRIQETKRTLEVLTRDGLVIKLDLSIRYHPEIEAIGFLHQEVGPDYVDKIVVPEVESVIRTSVGKMHSEQLYTGLGERRDTETMEVAEGAKSLEKSNLVKTATETQPSPTPPTSTSQGSGSTTSTRGSDTDVKNAQGESGADETNQAATLQEVIQNSIRKVSRKYVLIDDVIITRAGIPDQIQKAIQAKLEQKELAKAQYYRIAQAKSEFYIKRQEADNNKQIADSLTPQILKLKGIEATKELATSPNSKIIVIGNSSGGLPIILNSEK